MPSSDAASPSPRSARTTRAACARCSQRIASSATGSDASIAALAARVRPPRRLVGSGHRLSVAALGPGAQDGAALAAAAEGIALDVALWDQQGCLSPLAVYVVGGCDTASDRVAEGLARALEALERRLPRGKLDPEAGAAFLHECDSAELRAAAGGRVRLLGGVLQRFAVVREADAALRPAPLHRFVRVHPVADAPALRAALLPLGPHLAGVALAGFGPGADALARGLADLGASRLCRPGELQAPPLAWRHDNRPVLLPLARFTDRDARGVEWPGEDPSGHTEESDELLDLRRDPAGPRQALHLSESLDAHARGLTPPQHEVVLCDENVEDIEFDVAADIVGVTGYIVHRERMFEIIDEFRRRGRFVVGGGTFRLSVSRAAPRALRRALRRRGRGDLDRGSSPISRRAFRRASTGPKRSRT